MLKADNQGNYWKCVSIFLLLTDISRL